MSHRWWNHKRKDIKLAKPKTRKMTPEERQQMNDEIEKDMNRSWHSSICGGLDERGNYTALHHR